MDLPVCRVCFAFVADPVGHITWHMKVEGKLSIDWTHCPLCGSLWGDEYSCIRGHNFHGVKP